MEIEKIVQFGKDTLINRIKKVHLRGQPNKLPYAHATVTLNDVSPYDIRPAQLYVLKDNLLRQQQLQWELEKHGVDVFNLQGFVRIYLKGHSDPIDLLPPVVEDSLEANGVIYPLLNDGMHRVYNALMSHFHITVVRVQHIPREMPYYAFPIPGSDPWTRVKIVDSLPEGTMKKWYRRPNHKALYRDFNTAFESVGNSRGFDAPAVTHNPLAPEASLREKDVLERGYM